MKNHGNQITLLDTFPDFIQYWTIYSKAPVEEQINGWVYQYMQKWPQLLKKQVNQYRSEGYEWRRIAKENVFPKIKTNLSKIRLVRRLLVQESWQIIRNAREKFDFYQPLYLIIYVGIGLGAGWETKYRKLPALLFGLENIAEEDWTSAAEIRGLITHELGHLVHSFWREKAGKRIISNPLWQLYTEGFADRFENSLQSNKKIHRDSMDQESVWFGKNKRWLAREFLKRLENNGDFRPFFGSWYRIRGHSQTGYFIGSEIVKRLEESFSLKEIAGLNQINQRMKRRLWEMAAGL